MHFDMAPTASSSQGLERELSLPEVPAAPSHSRALGRREAVGKSLRKPLQLMVWAVGGCCVLFFFFL